MSEPNKKLNWQAFPIALFVVVAYLLMGFLGNLWHPGWLVFFAIPLYHWTVYLLTQKSIKGLPVFLSVVVSAVVYLAVGFGAGKWHPTWIIFFAIPITASLESFFSGGLRGKMERIGGKIKSKMGLGEDDDNDIHMPND